MTREEFEMIEKLSHASHELISADDLSNKSNRTLLYGYTCARKTFHVYLKDMKIHTVVYRHDYSGDKLKPMDMREIDVLENCNYIPDKRIYSERSDFEFCSKLKQLGYHLTFNAYDDFVAERTKRDEFYGFTLEDIEIVKGTWCEV